MFRGILLPARSERQRHPRPDPPQPGLGIQPDHAEDQLGPYSNLASGAATLTDAKINDFFNDASFGVASDQVASTTAPGGRTDVTIVRDKKTGMHITGTTRYGTEYGAGYAAAQDRLWLMDVFRHVGRGQLTSFAGGASSNQGLERVLAQRALHRGRSAGDPDRQRHREQRSPRSAGPRRRQRLHRRHQRLHRRLRQRPLLPR